MASPPALFNKADCGNQNPLACTRTKFAALKAVAQTTIFVRIGNDVSKTLFNKKETGRIDATFSTLAQKVATMLDKICNVPTAQPTTASPTAQPTAQPTKAKPTTQPTTQPTTGV